jgi:uracil-DNA glycosylase family 4
MEDPDRIEQEIEQVLHSLKDYLLYQKEQGVEGLPAAQYHSRPGRAQLLEEISKELGDCKRCKLHGHRRHIVFGMGNPEARLVFVGEGPGGDEDMQGKPFVGRAGQLLTKIINSIDLTREEVYIANIIKCRPPQNRNPETDEIKACEPFLFKQLDAIKPKIICALGTFAAQTLLETDEKISRLRGRFISFRNAKLIATFHPAYLLRNPQRKRDVWEDMKKIRDEYSR